MQRDIVSVIKNVNGAFANIRHGHETFADISGHSFNYMNIDHIILLANGYVESVKMMQETVSLSQEVLSKYTLGDLIPDFFKDSRSVGTQFLKLLSGADYHTLEFFIKHLGNFNRKFKIGEEQLEEIWRFLEFFSNEK